MKKSILCLITALLSLTFIPAQIQAESVPTSASIPSSNSAAAAQANFLLNRLNEISLMDKSELSSLEKKQLRKEVRSTKKQLRENDGGIYLSVGAVVIILLVLILLL